MKIVSVYSAKGGVGKTTIAMCLARRLHDRGYRVHAIDLDDRKRLSRYFAEDDPVLSVDARGTDLGEALDELLGLAREPEIIVIDTAGADTTSGYIATGMSDLVLVPVGPGAFDLEEALVAVREVRAAARVARRAIPTAVVRTRWRGATLVARTIEEALAEEGVSLLRASLSHLTAFEQIGFGGGVPQRGDAGLQVDRLADEVLTVLDLPVVVRAA